MLHPLCGILNVRVFAAASSGPPNAPVAFRVSAMRHGVTGMNCNAPVEVVDAPVPVRVASCGEPVALSATERLAVNVPTDSGLNSTETVQVAFTASDDPQVLAEIRYEDAPVPVSVSDVSVAAAVPVFFTVTT